MRKTLLLAGLLGLASTTYAQIGSGWTAFSTSGIIDIQSSGTHKHFPDTDTDVSWEGARYTRVNGVETFRLVSTASNRVERRHNEHYTSGKRQMQGDVRINQVSNQSIHQIFYGSVGPQCMTKGYGSNGGELRKQGGSVVMISGINNVWVRYNYLHRVGTGMEIYINGSRKATNGSPTGDGGYNNKYGLYGTKVTTAPKVEWRNVRHFR